MSWWDYGYQMTAMANRTVLVDNNTWNNSHIAEVGRVSPFFFLTCFSAMLYLNYFRWVDAFLFFFF